MSEERIPFWYTKLGADESDRVAASIAGGRLSQGAVTEQFEAALAEVLGVPAVVATTSGTAALYLAAAALGLGPGDEVILPDRTFMATAHAVMLTGARVRLVDVHPDRTIVDEDRIEAAITPRTRALLPVHLNGNGADMSRVRSIAAAHGLIVFEDTAQGFGSRNAGGYLGTHSDAGCFSLGVTKIITTGQGGFVAVHDRELAERMRRFRSHGVADTFEATYERFGFNLKFTDVQASIGLAQLAKLDAKIAAHQRFHAYYRAALADLRYLRVLDVDRAAGAIPLWAEALVTDRDRVIALLEERNIQARPYLRSLHESAYLGHFDAADFPNAAYFARHGLFLPSGPDLPETWLERVCEALHDIAPDVPGELDGVERFSVA